MRPFVEMLTATSGLKGLLELAWSLPGQSSVAQSEYFRASARRQLVERACELNAQGCNVYMGAALRREDIPRRRRGCAGDVDFATAVWADFDDPGSADAALQRLAALGASPNYVLVTGQFPHKRCQMWWFFEERCYDLQRVTRLAKIFRDHLGADKAFNIARVMRAPGSIAWPTKGGRIPELTKRQTSSCASSRYSIDELDRRLGGLIPAPPPPIAKPADIDSQRAYGVQALQKEALAVRQTARGDRNNRLNLAAFKLGQLIGGALLARHDVESALLSAALEAGLERQEALNTIASGINAGVSQPRTPVIGISRDSTDARDELPNYRSNRDGLDWRKNGNDPWKRLSTPLRVLAHTRDSNGGGWGKLIELRDADDKLHRLIVRAALLAGDGLELRKWLFTRGLRMHDASKAAKDALVQYIHASNPAVKYVTTDRLGWADSECKAFVLPSEVIGDSSIVYQTDSLPKVAEHMKARGSAEAWRDSVGAFARGNPLLTLSISAAFACPLLEPLGLEGGGIHLHGKSSRGKTTLLRAAASVNGNGNYMQGWRTTLNALEDIAAACNSKILCLDELQTVPSPHEAGQAAYALTNGQAKARFNYRENESQKRKTWTLLFLSSGETGLVELLRDGKQRTQAGQEVRFLEIRATTRRHGAFDDIHGFQEAGEFANAIKQAADDQHGVAGPLFVRLLLEDRDRYLAWAREFIAGFAARTANVDWARADPQVRRAANRLAVVAAGGELATEMGLTGWAEGAATEAARVALQLWIKGRGGISGAEERAALARVRNFLLKHDSRFGPGNVANRAGWHVGGNFYIMTEAWEAEIHGGFDARQAAADLKAANILLPGEGGRYQRKTPSVAGHPRAYCISGKVLGL